MNFYRDFNLTAAKKIILTIYDETMKHNGTTKFGVKVGDKINIISLGRRRNLLGLQYRPVKCNERWE
jgi:hypothetical protein